MFKKIAGALVAVAVPSMAFAEGITVDYTSIGTGLLAQASSAITAALPVVGTIMGITLGYKLFKRFTGK